MVHSFTFAERWDELTAEQLGKLLLLQQSTLEPMEQRIRALRLLAGIPKKLMARACELDPEDIALPQLDAFFVLDPKAPVVFEKSLLPAIVHEGRTWCGPKNTLGNFSVLQLSFADICLQGVQQQQSDESLNNLLGALYVPEDENWTSEDIEARGAELASVAPHVKLAAAFNYAALRAWLPTRYPRTFGKRKKEEEEREDYGIDGLLEALAGEKFGTVDQVGAKPLHPALVHSERKLEEREQLETAK